MANARATRPTPSSIFTGVDGSALRFCSQTHSATSTGDSRITPSGSKTWNVSGAHVVSGVVARPERERIENLIEGHPEDERDAEDRQQRDHARADIAGVERLRLRRSLLDLGRGLGEMVIEDDEDDQREEHRDRGRHERDAPAVVRAQPRDGQRRDERADVDAHVIDVEALVAQFRPIAIEVADERRDVRLEQAAAAREQHQARSRRTATLRRPGRDGRASSARRRR